MEKMMMKENGVRIPWLFSRKSWQAHTSLNYFLTNVGEYRTESL